MKRTSLRGAASVLALGVVAGCATLPAGPTTEPSFAPLTDTSPTGTGTPLEFVACDREPADPASTNLRPNALTATDRALAGDLAEQIPDGTLVVEHAVDLTIPDGEIGFGNGYEAATATVPATRTVSDATVTAPVTLQVLDSPSSGRRVAFVEVRVSPEPPVRWAEEPALGFGTDGGDGGVVATADAPATGTDADFAQIDAYIDAFYPDGDSASGTVCVLREAAGTVDAVLFSAGWGDGGYPTYLGYGADGDVVSVVSHGFVVPWVLSGLPGEPPAIEGEESTG
ncbi:DUF4241 domain-containing protein [Actinotalea subterranea]|uniref:DUF4241 domain-containing protein n=1 Tax=Actinotalea subterranea TaxID=2607497 RepID=UPI00165D4809|nr:DUF4241 domain-containing protein [Actinotalea subterranea]